MTTCSHGLPLEHTCPQCVAEGLSRVQQAVEASARIPFLQARVAQLEAALAFYGEDGNWRRPTIGRRWRNSPADADKGSRARAVLFGLDG